MRYPKGRFPLTLKDEEIIKELPIWYSVEGFDNRTREYRLGLNFIDQSLYNMTDPKRTILVPQAEVEAHCEVVPGETITGLLNDD